VTDASRKAPRFIDTRAAVFLDLLRGLAALVVFAEHFRLLFFVGYNQIPTGRSKWGLAYLLASAGHQAVVVFFVLSGYLITGSVLRLVKTGRWSWRLYLTHRMVRLWIVLLPGLALGILWDRLGLFLHRAPATYSGANSVMIHDVAARLGFRVVLANALFLQTIKFPTLGSNGALWSLANEFWYYILFPCLMLMCWHGRRWPLRVVAGVAFALIAFFVGPEILLGFPVWLMGTALVYLRPMTIPRWVRGMAAAIYVAVFFALSRSPGREGWKNDIILGVVTMAFVWTLLCAREAANNRAPWVLFSRTLSRFSFSLYVVHTPLLLLLASVLVGDRRWQPSAGHLLAGCGVAVLALAYAYLFASVTEFRTDALRTRIERLVVPGTT
jgi:peptidoglycan/LPS O-acetylase OafA/YrhL